MTGFTYREACLLQSALLRRRAEQIAETTVDSMPLDSLADALGELQELQEQVHQLQEFVDLLDRTAGSVACLRVGQAH